MSQAEEADEIESPTQPTAAQVVPTSQLDMDPIEYASSMTSTYQQDELDDGKVFYSSFCSLMILNSRMRISSK